MCFIDGVRIEMTFGITQVQWGILQHAVQCKLSNVKHMIQAITWLHNFVINEQLQHLGIINFPPALR
jgi:hypothetical protein